MLRSRWRPFHGYPQSYRLASIPLATNTSYWRVVNHRDDEFVRPSSAPLAKRPMQLRRNRALWGALFLLLTLAASYKLRRTWEGTRGFYLWKQISGKAHQGQYVTSDGAQIYFETFGSGEPVLVLHGGGPGCRKRCRGRSGRSQTSIL